MVQPEGHNPITDIKDRRREQKEEEECQRQRGKEEEMMMGNAANTPVFIPLPEDFKSEPETSQMPLEDPDNRPGSSITHKSN
jgi:hypothetical protein